MDAANEWEQARQRVTELVGSVGAQDAERRVPACPDWTVRDLLSHMIGLDADVLAGDEPDDHNPAWTQRQVDARQDRDVATLLLEWEEMAGAMVAKVGDDPRPLGDVIIHEQDLRGALGRGGGQDSAGLGAIRDRMLERFSAAVSEAGLAAIRLQGGDGWTFSAGDGPPAVVVEAPTFDLARSVMARRSAAQLRSWVTQGDVEPYLDAFATLGPLPTADLTE